MNKRTLISFGLIAAALTACTPTDPAEQQGPGPESFATGSAPAAALPKDTLNDHAGDIKLKAKGLRTEFGMTTYRYKISATNPGPNEATYMIKLDIRGKDGEFLGEWFVNFERLGPGKTESKDEQIFDHTVKNKDLDQIASLKVVETFYCDGSDTAKEALRCGPDGKGY